jgi:Flp pilus assembly protein TadG
MTPPFGHQHASRPDRQAGQVLVLAVVFALGLLVLLGLVTDGGLVFAARRDLQRTADAAARAGAAQLDQAAYRASGGATAQLDPRQATTAAHRYLRAAGFASRADVSADPASVTVTVATSMRPPVLGTVGVGPVRLAARALARPRTGTLQPQGP